MNTEPAESRASADDEHAISAPSEATQVSSGTSPVDSSTPLDGFLLKLASRSPAPGTRAVPTRLDRFLRAPNVGAALHQWFGGSVDELSQDEIVRRLNRSVAVIDELLNRQLNTILHHPSFQKLEASWRGLYYLTQRTAEAADGNIKIKLLNASWKEIERDFERAVEFDQSQVFKKVYEHEFGMPGGEPYGVMIADYEIFPVPSPEHPHDDMSVLRSLAKVGAAAFCPIISNAHPAMLGMDSFAGLEHTINHSRTLEQQQFLAWKSLRNDDDSRFLALALPRTLMRTPYQDDGSRVDRFCFREDVSGPDASKYLWGGAAFAMGEVLIRSYADAGWLADIRGLQRNVERGGLVTNLPVHCFGTDKLGVAPKCSTDVIVTEELEMQLSELGFLPLCHCKDTEYSVFYSSQSIQKPKKYDRSIATVNARISSMLQYMLCVSRFAHYVKVIGRDKTGSFAEHSELEDYLQRWIVNYVTADVEASPDVKARRPLRDAEVRVTGMPGKPGAYHCVMHLAPHYELDEMSATVKLVAELTPASTS